ncbi:PREDICTED: peroxisome biogenesis protein 19-2-like [Nelumbo nucifera]|uniref:Peroxisome biogenesis protein 19-2-like n=1 Tax=Nelumbo nucifera TaxID=4432 RepID=A0A1U8AA10_NELNU|nr:PREDICTED: peroxisome biogenesis protein 19-2-like [Nelumbo nucifera]
MDDNSYYLEALLDSALGDFQDFNLDSSGQSNVDGGEEKKDKLSLPSGVQGLGNGLPDLISYNKKGKQKVSIESDVSVEPQKVRQQTREVVQEMDSTTDKVGGDDLTKEIMVDDLVKQIEELAGSQDMESIAETMMQQLLSKEILHGPIKEIGERYPKWLGDHKSGLSKEEYERYNHQYMIIKQLNVAYENDPGNFPKIVVLMQKMQECGQPPIDILQEFAPDMELTNLSLL